jgi:flagellar hook-associated protein 3 FlgL
MRVTNSMMLSSTLTGLNRSLERLQADQTTLSTGRTIRKVSDDPTGASSAMKVRSQLRQNEQHQRVLTDTQGWLDTADTAIVSGLDVMNRLKELTVRASNDGVANSTSRSAFAAEVGHLRDELMALANTEYLNRPIFNGTESGAAYDSSGTYLGNDAAVIREIGPGTMMTANLTGPAVFGDPSAPEGDVFAVLNRLQAAILTGDTAGVAAEHDHLDAARDTMLSAAGQIGARGARLENVQNRLATDDFTLRDTLSHLEDADIAEALISVKASENAYTAALQAAGKVLPPSLVDFMR